MLKPIYDQSKDKNVANYVVFAKAADSKLYKEAAFTNQVEEAELNDAFLKGRLVVCLDAENGVYAVAVKVSANKAYTLAMTGVSPSEVMSFVEWAAKAAA